MTDLAQMSERSERSERSEFLRRAILPSIAGKPARSAGRLRRAMGQALAILGSLDRRMKSNPKNRPRYTPIRHQAHCG